MRLHKIFGYQESFQLLIHSGNGSPHALRVNTRHVSALLSLFAILLVLLFLGTLMFFRELEISRKFEERILALELENKVPQVEASAVEATPPKVELKAVAKKEAKKIEPVISRPLATVPKPVPVVTPSSVVQARISGLTLSCKEKECLATVNMVPSKTGAAEGKLLLVLETQVERIGTVTHTDKVRKRYVVYPGFDELETFNPEAIKTVDGKPFKFSSALQSKVTFYIGSLLKPIGLDAYIYDKNDHLVTHRRRLIEAPQP